MAFYVYFDGMSCRFQAYSHQVHNINAQQDFKIETFFVYGIKIDLFKMLNIYFRYPDFFSENEENSASKNSVELFWCKK